MLATSRLPMTTLAVSVACLFGAAPLLAAQPAAPAIKVDFTATPAPTTGDDLLKTYTTSVAKVTFADGKTRDYPLSYVSLFKNTDKIATAKGKKFAAGQIFDKDINPVMEPKGDPAIAETADANSLLSVGNKLYIVNHWEYDDVLADGQTANKAKDWYSRMPMGMSLSAVVQGRDGRLKVTSQQPIDLSSVNGAWVLCFGSQTPWNTHFGGEEDYDLYFVPGEKAFKTTVAGLKAMSEVYFRGKQQANPYHYGYHIEVAVKEDGSQKITKHYQMGRGTWEMAIFANDGRTAFYGDDGTYSGVFMFVAHAPSMPKAGGTLYAAKWQQTSPDGSDGGTADFKWVKLGSSHYNEIKALIDEGIKIDGIRLVESNAGATYTFDLAGKQMDTGGQPIASDFVPVRAYVEPALLGRPIKADTLGNTEDPEFVANTDNVFFSEKMRTLFIGEDSGTHQNNYVWAYNVDSKKLTRILTLAAGAESTGLQLVENLNTHAYIMSNNQHQGDWIKSTPADLKEKLEKRAGELWGKNRHGVNNFRLEAHVGYIGGLPAFK